MANTHSNISFALVDIPIIMNPIIKNNDTSFNQIHKKCGKRISYVKYCPTCKKQVKDSEILKGYQYEQNHYVIFEKEELNRLKPENEHEIEIISFVNLKEIDPYYFEKSYVLTSTGKARSYSLFYQALKKTGLVALCKTSMNQKFYYGILRLQKEYMILTTLYFEEEINLPESNQKKEVNEKELNLAVQLIESLKGKFEPEKYIDEYQNQIKQAIESKVEGKEVKQTKRKKNKHIDDLMEALEKSLKK